MGRIEWGVTSVRIAYISEYLDGRWSRTYVVDVSSRSAFREIAKSQEEDLQSVTQNSGYGRFVFGHPGAEP